MGMAKKIKVYKAISTVLHRITMKREFAVIAKADKMTQFDNDRPDFLSLVDKSGAKVLLYVEDKVYSRERFDKKTCLAKILEKYPDIENDDVSFPTINDLYKIAEDKILEISFTDERRDQLNRKWISDYLQIGTNEGQWYMTDDFSAINIQLQKLERRMEEIWSLQRQKGRWIWQNLKYTTD